MQVMDIAGSSGGQELGGSVNAAGAALAEFAELLQSVVTLVQPSKQEEQVRAAPGNDSSGSAEEETAQGKETEKGSGNDLDPALLVNVMLPQEMLPAIAGKVKCDEGDEQRTSALDGNQEQSAKPVVRESEAGVAKMVFEALTGKEDIGLRETLDGLGIQNESVEHKSAEAGVSGLIRTKDQGGALSKGISKRGEKAESETRVVKDVQGMTLEEAKPSRAAVEASVPSVESDRTSTPGMRSVQVSGKMEAVEMQGPGGPVQAPAVRSREATEPVGTRAHEEEKVSAVAVAPEVGQKAPNRRAESDEGGASPSLPMELRQEQKRAAAASEKTVTEIANAEEPKLRPGRAMYVDRLAERLAGGELRFGFQSEVSGEIKVSTALHNRVVELGVMAERPEMVSALRAELPVLEAQLREHSLRLGGVEVSTGNTLGTQSQMEDGRHHRQREWTRSAVPVYRDSAVAEGEAVRTARGYGASRTISLMA